MENERGSLRRHECVDDKLHRPADALREDRVGFWVHRIGSSSWIASGPSVGRRAAAPRAQPIEAQARDDGGQPGGRIVDTRGAR
jgi:hypothetical protein